MIRLQVIVPQTITNPFISPPCHRPISKPNTHQAKHTSHFELAISENTTAPPTQCPIKNLPLQSKQSPIAGSLREQKGDCVALPYKAIAVESSLAAGARRGWLRQGNIQESPFQSDSFPSCR